MLSGSARGCGGPRSAMWLVGALSAVMCAAALATISLTTNPIDGEITAIVVDPARHERFLYYTTRSLPFSIVRLSLSDLSRAGTIVCDPDDDRLLSAAVVNCERRLFVGTAVGTVIRVSLSAFARDGTLRLSEGGAVQALVADNDAAWLYACTNGGRIVKISADSFAEAAVLRLQPGEEQIYSAVHHSSAGVLYVGLGTTPGRVVRVRTADMSRTGQFDLQGMESWVISMLLDTVHEDLIIGTHNTPGVVVKVRLADLRRTGSLTLDAQYLENSPYAAVIDAAAEYGFFACYTTPVRMIRVHLATMTRVGSFGAFFNLGSDLVRVAALDSYTNTAYFGAANTPGALLRVSLLNFWVDGTAAQTLTVTADSVTALVVDETAGFLYAGDEKQLLLKLRLSDLTRVSTYISVYNRVNFNAGTLDAAAGMVYFSSSMEPASVVQLRTRDFSSQSVIDLPGHAYSTALVFHAARRELFAVDASAPTHISRVNVDSLSIVKTGTLAAGTSPSAVVLDQAGDFLFVSSAAPSAAVFRVNVTTLAYDEVVPLVDSASVHALVVLQSGLLMTLLTSNGTTRLVSTLPGTSAPVTDLILPASMQLPSTASFDVSTGDLYVSVPSASPSMPTDDTSVLLVRFAPAERRVVGQVTLPSSGGRVGNGVAFDAAAGKGYFSTASRPGVVMQVRLSDMNLEATRILGLPPSQGPASFGLVDDGYLYLLGGRGTATLTRVATADFSFVDSMLLSSERGPQVVLKDTVTQTAFFCTGNVMLRLHLPTMRITGSLALPSWLSGPRAGAMVPNSTSILLGGFSSSSAPTIACIDSVELTILVTAPLQPFEGPALVALPDPHRGLMYVSTAGGAIISFNASTLNRVAAILPSWAQRYPVCGVINPQGTHVWFGTFADPGMVLKVELDSFALVNILTLEEGERQLCSVAMDSSGLFAFFGTAPETSLASIVQVNLETMERVSAVQLPDGSTVSGVVVDADTDMAYFNTYYFPFAVHKLNLSVGVPSMAERLLGALHLAPGEGEGWLSAGVTYQPPDGSGPFAFFVSALSPGFVIKVRVSDMARVDSVILPSGEENLQCAAVDSRTGIAYFGSGDTPAVVVQVDLREPRLRRLSSLRIPDGVGKLRFAVIQPSGQYLLLGAAAIPSVVVRIRLSDFSLSGNATLDDSGGGVVSCGTFNAAGDLLYIGMRSAPSRLIILRAADMAQLATASFAPGVDYVRSVVAAPNLLLWGTGTWPGRIVATEVPTESVLSISALSTIDLSSVLEAGIAGWAVDSAAGYSYCVTDAIPPTVVQLRLRDLTVTARYRLTEAAARPGAIVLVDGHPSVLIIATNSLPSRLFQLQATPRVPTLSEVSAGGTDRLAASGSLCVSFPLQHSLPCIYEADALLLGGTFAGHFTAGDRISAHVVVRAGFSLAASGVWTTVPLPALTIPCAGMQCPDGSTCICQLPVGALAATLPATVRANSSTTASPVLLALLAEAALALDGQWSPSLAFAVILQPPRIVRCTPAVIASHGAVLTVNGAFERRFNNGSDRLLLLDDAHLLDPVPCVVLSLSEDGQTLSCRPPPLEQRLLGVAFSVALERDGVIATTLSAAVQYAWLTFSAVYPVTGFSPAGAAPFAQLTVQSAALVPVAAQASDATGLSTTLPSANCSAPPPALRAWVGGSECTAVAFTSACSGTITLLVPPGVGVRVPITVEVAGRYNITSFEAVSAGGPASAFDGEYSLLPTPPKLGLRTTIDFARPVVTSLSPTRWVLTAAATSQVFTLSGVAFPPAPAVTLLLGGAYSCVMATDTATSTAACTVQASELVLAILGSENGNGSELLGSRQLPVSVHYHMPGWPATTSVLDSPAGMSLTVVGRPFLSGVSPEAGKGGTLVTIVGGGFGLPGENATVLFAASVPCRNVTCISDSQLQCVAPQFDVAAFGGLATVSVAVHSAAGASPVVHFTYSDEITIEWADVQDRDSDGGVTLPGIAPMWPLPVLRVLFGAPHSCSLVADGTMTLLNAATATPAANQRLVAFDAAAVANDGVSTAASRSFNASLFGACKNGDTVVHTSAPRTWVVSSPTVGWDGLFPEALAARAVFVPSANDLPAVKAAVTLPSSATGSQWANVSRLLACDASLAPHGSVASMLSAATGSFGRDIRFDAFDGSTASATVTFEGLSLAMASLGSTVVLTARCTWLPLHAVMELPPLYLKIVQATVLWQQKPPSLTESQSYLSPPPSVKLMPDAALLPMHRVACVIDAGKIAGQGGEATVEVAVNGSTADTSGATTDSVVITQHVSGAWDATIAFDSFSISGRRQARYNVTVTCTLGAQTLSVIHAETEIAGCTPGKEPGGSTGWLCNDCPSGTWSDGGSMTCVPCMSEGASCNGGMLQLQPGYYLSPLQAAAPLSPSTILLPCFNSEACVVNATARSFGCSTDLGYAADGPLCGVCSNGYALFGQSCSRCWSTAAAVALLLLIAVLSAAAAGYLGVWHQPGARAPAAIAFRQLVGYLQLVSVVIAFRVQAVGLMRAVLSWTEAANVSLLTFGPLACLLSTSFLSRYVITLLLPVLFGLLVAGTAMCADRLKSGAVLQPGARGPSTTTDLAHALSWRPRASPRASLTAALRSTPRTPPGPITPKQRLLSSILLICSLLYMPLLSASLKALDCYERSIDGVTFLRADLRVQCHTGSHIAVQILAWSVIVGLGAGFPVIICWGLLCRLPRKRPLAEHSHSSVSTSKSPASDFGVAWRPLYTGYGPSTPWWEAVILLRKALLALIGSQMGGGARGIACLAFVLVVCVVLQETVLPYDESRFNTNERVVLLGSLATAVLALLSSSESTSTVTNSALTAAMLLVTLLVLLFLAVRVAQAMRCGQVITRTHGALAARLAQRAFALTAAPRTTAPPLRLSRDGAAWLQRNHAAPAEVIERTQVSLVAAVATSNGSTNVRRAGGRDVADLGVRRVRLSCGTEQQWQANPIRTTVSAAAPDNLLRGTTAASERAELHSGRRSAGNLAGERQPLPSSPSPRTQQRQQFSATLPFLSPDGAR